jgi:hypothetical protein
MVGTTTMRVRRINIDLIKKLSTSGCNIDTGQNKQEANSTPFILWTAGTTCLMLMVSIKLSWTFIDRSIGGLGNIHPRTVRLGHRARIHGTQFVMFRYCNTYGILRDGHTKANCTPFTLPIVVDGRYDLSYTEFLLLFESTVFGPAVCDLMPPLD